ncbi:hypothetical protein BDP27DRAFT_1446544 [Rhodocollybia butyracea]|uniref:Uncharacterized protein n=1 Tax=Rhodocollybia butyracea TaxID=206335 RepID=A0A9P5PRS4_9AGAR|nr:hypothetical protein BDP27DRAFT_1446544 [Rhodocollybia butyracea]
MSSEFPTTRINRFLRPLRNRCASLASFVVRPTMPSATYASTNVFTKSVPPLCIIPSPNSATRLDSPSYELSQKIYAVCHVFKDIVEKTEEIRAQSEGKRLPRIPSLSMLCSLAIGTYADPEIEEDATRLEEEQSVHMVEALYDGIPALYRGWTLVSHAMTIILSECPLSPTLLKNLLDITLNHDLPYYSEILLCHLLSVALSPPTPNRSPPICHPAHSNFLLELLSRWEQNNNPSYTFFHLFNEVMAMGNYDAWVCKATTKLLLHDCRKDPLRLASVSSNLVRFISQPNLHLPSRSLSVSIIPQVSPSSALRRLLRMWLERVLHFCLLPIGVIDYFGFCEFLQICMQCWQGLSSFGNIPDQDVVSAIICIATLFLSRKMENSSDLLVLVLSQDLNSTSTTFAPLISQTFASFTVLSECSQRIETYASSLVECGLVQLEASLWASALREVENFDPLLQRYSKGALYEYRGLLIDRVEDAEYRCYGSRNDGLTEIINSPQTMQQRSGCDWEAPQRKRRFSDKNPTLTCYTRTYTLDFSSHLDGDQLKKRPRLIPRVSSFTSLLSNALSNRIVLHKENRQTDPDEEDDSSLHETDVVFPSSDDCLDLLAYGSSSPTRS